MDKLCKIQEILKLQQFKTQNSTTNTIPKSYLIIQNPDITKADPKIQQKQHHTFNFQDTAVGLCFFYIFLDE